MFPFSCWGVVLTHIPSSGFTKLLKVRSGAEAAPCSNFLDGRSRCIAVSRLGCSEATCLTGYGKGGRKGGRVTPKRIPHREILLTPSPPKAGKKLPRRELFFACSQRNQKTASAGDHHHPETAHGTEHGMAAVAKTLPTHNDSTGPNEYIGDKAL
jgi:hypothetical protein